MSTTRKKVGDFNDRVKIAVITAVDPQNKTVDIKYTTQDGSRKGLNLPYEICGGTYGRIHMPMVNDRVLVDFQQGDEPIIVGFRPNSTVLLPYLDPGELAEVGSDGSFVHIRNQRRRAISTGELLDFNATEGPGGPSDMELEPGGIVLGVRNPQNRDSRLPKWYEHSYLAMWDNGDINIQARYRGKEKGLIFMDGASGYVIITAGDGKPEEYIEFDPVTKAISIISNGDIHQHSQKDWKFTVYNNVLGKVAGALQFNIGIDPSDASQVNADYSKMNVDADLKPGDVRLDNTKTADPNPGNFYMHIKGDVDLTLDKGNVNITVATGNVNVSADQGNVDVEATNGKVVVNSKADQVYINGGASSTDRIATIKDVQNHTHGGVQSGTSWSTGGVDSGTSTPYSKGTGKAYLGQ